MTVDELRRLAETAPRERAAAFDQARAAAADPSREIRTASAGALAATGEPREALEWLARLAADEDVGVRYAAVAAIAGLPWKGRFLLLRRALEDTDLGIVALAADGLSYAGDHRVAETLRSLLDERRLQFGALEGLYLLRDKEAIPIAKRLFDALLTPLFERTMAALILAREGHAEARRYLEKRLTKRFTGERGLIIKHLIEVDTVEGRAIVERIAGEPRDDQRETALLALTRQEPAAWWPRTAATIAEAILADDLTGASEILLSLSEIDLKRAMPLSVQHQARQDDLGGAARRLLLTASLRESFPEEVQLRCD